MITRSDPDLTPIGKVVEVILRPHRTVGTRGRRVSGRRNAGNNASLLIPDLLRFMLTGLADIVPHFIALHECDKDILRSALAHHLTV